MVQQLRSRFVLSKEEEPPSTLTRIKECSLYEQVIQQNNRCACRFLMGLWEEKIRKGGLTKHDILSFSTIKLKGNKHK